LKECEYRQQQKEIWKCWWIVGRGHAWA